MDLTKWIKACSSKEQGRLAIRRLDHFNNACLAKLKVLTIDDSWWVQIVKRKYLRKDNFIDCNVKRNHSLAWKAIFNNTQGYEVDNG